MRVLVADDDLTSRTILAAILAKEGHQVETVVDGAEAWKALQQPDAPELIILDWVMPEINGPNVARLVRGLKTDKPPYILMLTARDHKADIVAGLKAGANDYVTKPFDSGELCARIGVGRRMIEMQTALLSSQQALAHQASHDSLTGLLNRHSILDKLQTEVARANRNAKEWGVGVCDLDHFKRVNDTHGHQAGDDLLRGFAQVLVDHLRPYDAAGRIGGEEFLIIAPDMAKADLPSLFHRLCAVVATSKITTRTGVLSITVSIGVASATPGTTADAMLADADAALYRAKAEGRNRVAYDDIPSLSPLTSVYSLPERAGVT